MWNAPFCQDDLRKLKRTTFLADGELLAEVDSTNDHALRLCQSANDPAAIRTPYLILAESQTRGRGRGVNRWCSLPGAVTFSLILSRSQIDLPPEQQCRLSLLVGLAVCDTIAGLVPPQSVGLKWPNDVWLQGRKVCGILIEVAPPPVQHVVIGIGLNVNNSFRDAPAGLQATATSLCDELGTELSRTELMTDLLQSIERELDETQHAGQQLAERFRRWCLLTGAQVRMETDHGERTGICRGIDQAGRLLLETPKGVERFVAGQAVRFGSEYQV